MVQLHHISRCQGLARTYHYDDDCDPRGSLTVYWNWAARLQAVMCGLRCCGLRDAIVGSLPCKSSEEDSSVVLVMSVTQGLHNRQGAEDVLYISLLRMPEPYKEHSVN